MIILTIFVVTSYLTLAILAHSWLYSLGFLLIGAVLAWIVRRRFFNKSYFIEIGDSGALHLNQMGPYQLMPSSRLSWLGCWLIVKSDSKSIQETRAVFIFKDSLSRRDYSRLSRWLLRFKLGGYQESVW